MARVVAELGRPETPDETAARKAESSRVYRSSQTFRGLIAALLATLAVVAIVVLGVPRGEPAERPPIDAGAEAAALEASWGRPVLGPEIDGWRVNSAAVEGDSIEAWTLVYVPDDDPGFLRVSQGFDADETWPLEVLSGNRPTGTVTIDGVQWDEYLIGNPERAGNVSYALGTDAGTDRVLVYGSATPETAAVAAEALAAGILELRADAP